MTEDQQDQLVISLDTQYAVAHAIYNRFHANGHRKHLTWENLDDDGRSLNKAIRLWNHHASHHQRNEQ